MNVYIILAIDIFFVIVANILLKKGASIVSVLELSPENMVSSIFSFAKNPYIILGLISYGISFIMWLFVLSKLKLGIAYPVAVSLNICLLTVASVLFFKETVTTLQVIGIFIIIAGLFLLVGRS